MFLILQWQIVLCIKWNIVYTKGCFVFYLDRCPFIVYRKNKIIDNAHNTYYNEVEKRKGEMP